MVRGGGSISLIIDSPLRDFAMALRALPSEIHTQVPAQVKPEARTIWGEELRGHGNTRIQQRVLVGSASVSVTQRNTTFISGGRGKLSSGTPVSTLARAAEFGMNAGKPIKSRSKNGTPYTRRAGNAFGPNRRGGNTVYPAAPAAISRVLSLQVQTVRRAIHETIEEVSS